MSIPVPPKGGGGHFEPAPAGMYAAVCVDWRDLGLIVSVAPCSIHSTMRSAACLTVKPRTH